MDDIAGEAMASLESRSSGEPALNPLERIIGKKNELMRACFMTDGAIVVRSVGRLVVRSASGAVLGYGTGFLVSPRLLMTNNHVLGSAAEARNSTHPVQLRGSLQWLPRRA